VTAEVRAPAACLMIHGTASGVGKSPRRWDRLADVVAGSLDVEAISRLVGRAL
jgi:hypothetical protein